MLKGALLFRHGLPCRRISLKKTSKSSYLIVKQVKEMNRHGLILNDRTIMRELSKLNRKHSKTNSPVGFEEDE